MAAAARPVEGHLDQLIPVVNKVQDVLSAVNMTNKMDLPQIAVVGAQSSGKSSVLENIVGRDFLPRGSGIVTRRPLLLQLRRVTEAEARGRREAGKPTEWAVFLHKPGEIFTDFSRVRAEITAETDRLCGNTRNVHPAQIGLTINSDRVVDLTLIDLPGLTKVAVDGQPEDMARQIEECVLAWIAPKNTIILAVSAANQDIANSDAINIARRVDPAGDRTVGVLTKLDLMDRGTDAMDVLMGRVVRLKKGFVGVVNRSQQDIDSQKAIGEALNQERKFFQEHPAYSKIADKMGTQFLVRTLNKTLLMHINMCIPEIRSRIQDLLEQTEAMLKQFGSGHSGSPDQRMLAVLSTYSGAVERMLNGTAADITKYTELVGGARINYLLNVGFVPFLQQLDPFHDISDEQIRAVIHNSQGTNESLFVPEGAFNVLARSVVQKLEPPAQRCVDYIFEELAKICENCEEHVQRYPLLKQRLGDFTHDLLQQLKRPCCQFISDMIRIEQAHINTKHPDFFGGCHPDQLLPELNQWTQSRREAHQQQQQLQLSEQQTAAAARRGQRGGGTPPAVGGQGGARQDDQAMDFSAAVPQHIRHEGLPDDKEHREQELIKHLVLTYFGIVRKHVQDQVPKTLMYFMVNKLRSELKDRLMMEFYKEHLMEELLHESEDVVRKRKAAENMRKALSEAANTLNAVREFRC
eukprot:TRINITY_DN7465_c0_g1_i1.p1 TRINITY_DN7465_c0_g1~~TRINITY_DN7465_c0_g1_i1.p1  ORF type:complete len:724 (+),score=295.05 TRINITY_DN7465_c0_g1_i1:94-2172(+)